MEARQLINTPTFPPDAHVLFDAFDGAWKELAPDVATETVERARWELATIVIGLAGAAPIERDRLKADAVLSYRLGHELA